MVIWLYGYIVPTIDQDVPVPSVKLSAIETKILKLKIYSQLKNPLLQFFCYTLRDLLKNIYPIQN